MKLSTGFMSWNWP